MSATEAPHWSLVAEPLWVRRAKRRQLHISPVTRAIGVVAISWIPLLLLSMGDRADLQSFAADLRVHARLLVSVPVMLLSESVIARRLGLATHQFRAAGLIPPQQLGAFTALQSRLTALRDSRWAIAALVATALVISLLLRVPSDPVWRVGGGTSIWYGAVSTPIFWFVVLRWIWRMGLLGVFLLKVSALGVHITPSHPDGKGGLGFLSDAMTSFSWIAFAGGMPVVAAAYEKGDVALGPRGFPHYAVPLVAVGLLVAVLVFAPLFVFSRRLRWHRRKDSLEFSAAAAFQARAFDEAWLKGSQPKPASVLTAPDFSAVADFQATYARSEIGNWNPIKVRSVLIVVMGALHAAVPFLLLEHELIEVAKRLLEALR